MSRTLGASCSKHLHWHFYGENCDPVAAGNGNSILPSSIPLRSHQDETSLVFLLPTNQNP